MPWNACCFFVDDRFKHWRLKTLAWHVGMASWLCFQFPSLNNWSWGKKKVWRHVLGGKDCSSKVCLGDVTCHLGMSSARALWGIGPRRRWLDCHWTRMAKRMTGLPCQAGCAELSFTQNSQFVGSQVKPDYLHRIHQLAQNLLAMFHHDFSMGLGLIPMFLVGISWGSGMDLQCDIWPCDDRWDHCALSMAWKHRSWRWFSVRMTSIIIVDVFHVFPHVFLFEDCLTLKARELKQRFELGHKQNGENVYPSNFSC